MLCWCDHWTELCGPSWVAGNRADQATGRLLFVKMVRKPFSPNWLTDRLTWCLGPLFVNFNSMLLCFFFVPYAPLSLSVLTQRCWGQRSAEGEGGWAGQMVTCVSALRQNAFPSPTAHWQSSLRTRLLPIPQSCRSWGGGYDLGFGPEQSHPGQPLLWPFPQTGVLQPSFSLCERPQQSKLRHTLTKTSDLSCCQQQYFSQC